MSTSFLGKLGSALGNQRFPKENLAPLKEVSDSLKQIQIYVRKFEISLRKLSTIYGSQGFPAENPPLEKSKTYKR